MCEWGTDQAIHVIRRNNARIPDGWHEVYVDACIAGYVQRMNEQGIVTESCCCGHGKGTGIVLVALESMPLMAKHGYACKVEWWQVGDEQGRTIFEQRVVHTIPNFL